MSDTSFESSSISKTNENKYKNTGNKKINRAEARKTLFFGQELLQTEIIFNQKIIGPSKIRKINGTAGIIPTVCSKKYAFGKIEATLVGIGPAI
jgi:hypothetical protein